MFDLSWPNEGGQENVMSTPVVSATKREPQRRRSDALRLTDDEAKAVRIAIRKLVRAFGSYNRLAAMLEIPSNSLRRLTNPNGARPTGTFAIRLAAIAKVPVEVLLGGKMVVTTPIIGRAA
jgi:hypothetical protein